MPTAIHHILPAVRPAHRHILAALVLGGGIVSMACSGSPMSPTHDTLSSERRVQTGGGGGTLCQPPVCPGFEGRIEIVAGGGALSGATHGVQLAGGSTEFELTATLKGSGRYGDGFIDAVFERDQATIRTIWFTRGQQIYQDTNVTGTASYSEIADKSCESGTLLETRVTVNLENLGRTQIVERHCLPGGA